MRRLRIVLFALSITMFVYGGFWTIGHGGDWEDGSRARPVLFVEAKSSIEASVVQGELGVERSTWLADAANWTPIVERIEMTGLIDRPANEAEERYCLPGERVIVRGSAPPPPVDAASVEVLAEFSADDCFAGRLTLLSVDADGSIERSELPEPGGPVWGYFVLGLSWLPALIAYVLSRRRADG